MAQADTSGETDTDSYGRESPASDTDGEYSRRGFMEKAGTMSAAGATAGLAGCIGGDGTQGTGEGDFLWWTMRGYIPEETEAIQNAAEGFEDWADEEVNVTTNVVTWDQVFEEWTAAIQGQNTPNVSEMANEHAVDYGVSGVVQPNTELFEQYDDWYEVPSYWGDYDGEVWGFPWFIEVRSFYSNMGLLEDAGHDSPPETWEELIEMAMDVEDETGETGFVSGGAQDTGTGQVVYGITAQSGGDFFDRDGDEWSVELDSPTSLFAHLWMASFQEEWDIAPGGWAGMDSTDAEQLYREGNAAFMINSGDAANEMINEDEDVADRTELSLIPEGPMGTNTSFMGGSCLSAFEPEYAQHDVDDEISMSFIEYMTLPETMEEYLTEATPNFLPVRDAQEEIPPFTDNPTNIPDEWIDSRLEQAEDVARYGITGPEQNAPFLGDVEGATDAYSTAISGILGGGEDPREAVVAQANQVREGVDGEAGQEIEQNTDLPDLDDAPDELQPWIQGDGDTPQIWNP
ncbi:sugar ABC transporter substrate-binding protein [Natronococcus occultus]|uniref:ABC-type sugar transport system, periplasmic component n=1 Tax=Natronococcus occultus SP4 TaxID=694430 RepID=L0K465_9EURY|nr:extracellular solute-binding protein [Natronococcus occultus]AGB38898.1 ABC-type sugar transport system, periplasmic component [Natronococcus occultus SP4]